MREPEKLAGEGPNIKPPVAHIVDETFTGDATDKGSWHKKIHLHFGIQQADGKHPVVRVICQ